jgi:hypothetical protein
MKGATSSTGTAHSSGTPEFILGTLCVAQSLVCSWLLVAFLSPFPVIIVFSILLSICDPFWHLQAFQKNWSTYGNMHLQKNVDLSLFDTDQLNVNARLALIISQTAENRL